MPFSKLGLTPSLCTPLVKMGYTQPTPVQLTSIPIVLTGADLLAQAQTGTGKTAAFGAADDRAPAVCASAAPRLALRSGSSSCRRASSRIQVQRALATYGAAGDLRVTAIFGGVGMAPQINALRNGIDIMVATPGRLIDHLQQRTVDLSSIEMLVLDEADRMLDMGFMPAAAPHAAVLPRLASDAAVFGNAVRRRRETLGRLHARSAAR